MKATIVFVAGVCTLFTAFSLIAQESAGQRHEMATNQLKRLAAELSAKCLTDVRSLEDWKKQRPELRRQLREMLSLDPLPKRTDLNARVTGELKREKYRVEKVVFQSMPGLYVTGNFYVPGGIEKPAATVLYLCGHSPHPLGAKWNYQDRPIWFAEHGYPCLSLDTLEFGEVAGVHHGTHDLNMWNWFSLGYTPAGVETWNAMRAIDYLETRKEVDAKRIGVTGISGGGAITWYTAAVDERVAAAAPVCATFTWGSQAEHWVARGQCDCIYYNNSYGWDFPVVAALIAPRPLMMLSGQKDSIFPPDGYHAVFERAKKVYGFYGVEEKIREVDDNVEHSDPPLFLKESRQWMQLWLREDTTPLALETNTAPRIPAEELAVLKGYPEDAINSSVHNRFTKLATLNEPRSKGAWKERRAEVVDQVWRRVFGWIPSEKIPFDTKVSKSGGGWHVRYGYTDYKECTIQSENGVRVRAQLQIPKGGAGASAPLLVWVKRTEDSFNSSDADEMLPVFGRYTVLALNPRLTEVPMGPQDATDVERTATWVGRTTAAMQVWDLMRAIDWAIMDQNLQTTNISVYAKGQMGVVALYAALFDERIQQVILNDAPGSHWSGPALLNVLRITDIAEVAGALAPRELVSLTKFPAEFELAKAIYRVEGGSMTQAGSVPEALKVWKYSR